MFGLAKLRTAALCLRKVAPRQVTSLRHGSHAWYYRRLCDPPSTSTMVKAEFVGAFMWYWLMWHFWHESGKVLGENPYPDPLQWTDEELGIPPDDED